VRTHQVSGRAWDAGDTLSKTLRRAITDIYLAFYRPTGIVLHPNEGEELELETDDNGQFLRIYDRSTQQIWRVPVLETPAQTAGTATVGAFDIGATLWDRMMTQIRVGEPNGMFLQNAVAILAELRAAFAVTRPQAFEVVDGLGA
jgi:HK97 family phage major capsid protein